MKNLIVIFLLFFGDSLVYPYLWPIKNSQGNFNGPLPVSATLGDVRGSATNPRFHRGIDIPAVAWTNVYSLESWNVPENFNINLKGVKIGDYHYEHVNLSIKANDLVVGILDDPNNPTTIGTVADNHLHFQIGSSTGPYINPLSYNGGPDNYTDTLNPIVYEHSNDSWWFWKDGSEGDNPIRLYPENIYGKMDLRVSMEDRQNSGNSEQRSGVYSVAYALSDSNGNWVIPPISTREFVQAQPPNNGNQVFLSHDKNNYRTVAPFYYWVTNPLINNNFENGYINTKLKTGNPWNGFDAIYPGESAYPDGKYTVWALAYDIKGNGGDMVNRKGAEDEEIIIDNFRPYTEAVEISDMEDNLKYSSNWQYQENNLTLNRSLPGYLLPGGDYKLKIKYSEDMMRRG